MYFDELARFAGKVQLMNGNEIKNISKEELKSIENIEFIINNEKNIEAFSKFYTKIVGSDPSKRQNISFENFSKKQTLIEDSSNEQANEFVKRSKSSPLN
jgi:adenosine/AMP kinase